MEEEEFEDMFIGAFDIEESNLDQDYIEQFIERAGKGLIRKYGLHELNAVLVLQTKENQEVDNDMRWILEVGCLLILFYEKLESSDLHKTQLRLFAILYLQNQHLARFLVMHKLLPSECNILFSYTDLSVVLTGSQQIFMSHCFDRQNNVLIPDAQTKLYEQFQHLIVPLLLPR